GRTLRRELIVYKAMLGGNIEKAIENVKMTVLDAETSGDIAKASGSLNRMGELFMSIGDYDKSIEHYQKSINNMVSHNVTVILLMVAYPMLGLAYLRKLRKETPSKKELYHIRKHINKLIKKSYKMSLFKPLALLCDAIYKWHCKKMKAAHKLFSCSLNESKKYGSMLWQAHAYYDYGQCLFMDEDESQKTLGKQHLESALELYNKCGCVPYITSVEKLLENM
ncbi:unnamed protein product, partial [marine sediment metagenome]